MTKQRDLVIVTGCTKGIGAAIVDELFAQCSQNKESPAVSVLGIARSRILLQQMSEKYGEDNFSYVCGDVTQEQTVQEMCDFVSAKCTTDNGSSEHDTLFLKSVVFNAGVLSPVSTIDASSADIEGWKKLYDVNFFSIVNMTMRLLPIFEQSRAHRKNQSVQNFVFVSSGASTKPYKSWGAYGSSKCALNHFASTLAAEQADNVTESAESSVPLVRSVSVAPGVVDTEMQEDIRYKFDTLMPRDFHNRFTTLHKNKELLPPQIPAKVYARLALNDIPVELNGKYLRYNEV
ncbi:hypothetical protein ACO0RG_003824 [Hanseniaspora osmophila]